MVHVWRVSLSAESRALRQCRALLSDDERARADRFVVAGDRERFTVARGSLRRLLASYIAVAADALSFAYGAHGKPSLAGKSGLRFNLSHAADSAMIAIAVQREVGIDIEATMRDVDVDGVARKTFSSDECVRLAALAPAERRAAFFRIWTRKEAYVKARGEGFGYPTRSFSVSDAHCDPDLLIADERDATAHLHWRICALDVPDGLCAAVASPGRDWSVLRCELPDMDTC